MTEQPASQLVTDSLSLLGERVGDPFKLVYERLFDLHPEYAGLFDLDTNGDVRGQMLSEALEILLDFEAGNARALTLFKAALFAHDGYGVDASHFTDFFEAIRYVARQAAGSDWSDSTDAAWTDLLIKLRCN